MEWIEKYQPKTMSELIGNKKAINDILYWLQKNNGNLIITGKHGIGKTVIVDVILKSLNYEVDKIKKNIDIYPLCKSFMLHNNILSVIKQNKSKNIIVIDNFELISSKADRSGLLNIMKINNNENIKPIIIISDGKHNKFLVEVKKISKEIKFQSPSYYESIKLLRRITKLENMNVSCEVENDIINLVSGNIRQMILVLFQLNEMFKGKEITDKEWDEFEKNNVELMDNDVDLFKNSNRIIREFSNIETILRKYKSDKVLLPLMVHQNYIRYIGNNIDALLNVSNLLSKGDLVESLIYNDQNWEIEDVHGIDTCVIPSYIMTKLNKNVIRLDFPSDLNKTSTKKTNKKNIKVGKFNISDFIMVNNLFSILGSNMKKNELTKIIEKYDIKAELIKRLSFDGKKKK